MPIKHIHNPLSDTRSIPNLATLIRENAELYNDVACYVYKENKQIKEYSYKELYENATNFGAALEKLELLGKCFT